jgi:serine protease AprX
VVAGAAALVLQQRPGITPDQVKFLLTRTAQRLPAADDTAQGAGLLHLKRLRDTATPPALLATQLHPRATGLGSLDSARGTAHVQIDGVELHGETDVTGRTWVGAVRTAATASRTAWSGGGLLDSVTGVLGFAAGAWHGDPWNGHTWNADTYAGYAWDGTTWTFTPWSGEATDGSLEGKTWSGKTWSGKTWSGKTWSGKTWSGKTWSGKTWSGKTWSGTGWS